MSEWLQLEKQCNECKKCSLWENRKNVVIGRGNKTAAFMLIGEAPGKKRIYRAGLSWEERDSCYPWLCRQWV